MTDSRLSCECGHIGSRHGHDRQACAAVDCDCRQYSRHRYADAIARAEAIAAYGVGEEEVDDRDFMLQVADAIHDHRHDGWWRQFTAVRSLLEARDAAGGVT